MRFLLALVLATASFFVQAQVEPQVSLDAPRSRPASPPVAKNLTCNNYSIIENMFSDVCWSGIFPIRIIGATFKSGSAPYPEGANKKALCTCSGDLAKGELPKIGFSVGMWMPSRLVDVTRRPMCFASLGGKSINGFSLDWMTSGANQGRAQGGASFYNWVMYSAPFIYMLRLLDESACAPEGLYDFDVLNMSMVFPNWNDVFGRYTMFLNPEVLLFANPLMQAAGPIDMMSLVGNKTPINRLHWVAGNWGNIYPLTGWANEPSDVVGFSSLIATRAMALTHRLGLVKDTVGEENLCKRNVRFVMRKDAFRWQMVSPSPETVDSAPASENIAGNVRQTNFESKLNTCTHPTGFPTAGWGMWRDVPSTGEDHSYMVFRWTDCCFGLTPGL